VNPQNQDSDAFFVGFMGGAIVLALQALRRGDSHSAKVILDGTLRDFMRSPVADAELRKTLKTLGR
jgi:hypothetical protein